MLHPNSTSRARRNLVVRAGCIDLKKVKSRFSSLTSLLLCVDVPSFTYRGYITMGVLTGCLIHRSQTNCSKTSLLRG
ncbi:hypothetical protein AALO_G00166880 [Alosa alosa]|uniref:Uncharacterized protein n=1 Tax=Alosa alosa TaxID=278164 RepID=A0AAV6GG66_9TELE|nr:hypothetical protein AALO_G00166880 [Alosa alosa]